ncbi:MAG: hypothetical protein ACI8Z5_001718, partial [Lentimonas sp.]
MFEEFASQRKEGNFAILTDLQGYIQPARSFNKTVTKYLQSATNI